MIMHLPAAYQILDLPIGSSLEVVQVRYRQLVKKYHPDRFSNSHDKAAAEVHLKRINEAKEVIQKHWFDAKIMASEPIPYGAKEPAASNQSKAQSNAQSSTASSAGAASTANAASTASTASSSQSQASGRAATKPKEHPKAPPQSSPQAPPQNPPQSPSQAQVWWQQILLLFLAELQDLLNKFEKKAPLDDALEQLDKPFKFSSETKLRRAWYTVAIIIIVDLAYIGYCENMARRKAHSLENQAQTQTQMQTPGPAQTRYLRGLTPTAGVSYQSPSQQEKQKEFLAQKEKQQRLETAIYFKKLELDAANRAIAKDSELIDEIEIKLTCEDMANESRRSLEHLKVFRQQDKKQKEIERASILEELAQQILSQQQPG